MIVILGGGLAGLATAYYLGDRPHVVLEGADRPGGLCGSRTVDGFTFDYTGHLLHMRDPRTIALLDELWPDVFDVVERSAKIRARGVDLDFPYQANLHGLPKDEVARSVVGFVASLDREVPTDPTASFRDWALAVFGPGISEGFMFSYNRKLFRREPEDMTADWVSWAVPKPTLEEVVRGALGLRNEGMGYNPTFRYPKRGGIEAVPKAFEDRVDHVRCGVRVTGVDLDARTVTTDGGETIPYTALVATNPLPQLLGMARGGGVDWAAHGVRLDWSVVGCVNLGVDRPDLGGGTHWMYFPDDEVPFYRVGFPSGFSDGVAPEGMSSMYVEFGLRRDETFEPDTLRDRAIDGLRRAGILTPDDRIVASDVLRIDPGYVIFDRARQEVMAAVMPALRELGVYPIGRYGAWTYSYMERAILDGMELAEELREAPAGVGS